MLATIRFARFAHSAGRRVRPERFVISAPIVVAGEPESARRPENQQRGRKRHPAGPPARFRAKPTVGGIAEKFRGIKGREVRAPAVVRALERGPGRVDDKSRESEERQQRLYPPRVRSGGLTEPAPIEGSVRVGHGKNSVPPCTPEVGQLIRGRGCKIKRGLSIRVKRDP